MNERIRELNLQALSEVLNGADPDRDVDRMYIPAEFTKKFAELIVGECAKIAEKEQAFNNRYTDAHLHPQVNIDQCILLEFGL